VCSFIYGGFIEITNQGTDGHVIVDAVQLVPVEMVLKPNTFGN
jgi:hypothetical protein